MKMAMGAIMLVISISIVYSVITGASTGTWSPAVIGIVVIIPLVMVATWLARQAGFMGD